MDLQERTVKKWQDYRHSLILKPRHGRYTSEPPIPSPPLPLHPSQTRREGQLQKLHSSAQHNLVPKNQTQLLHLFNPLETHYTAINPTERLSNLLIFCNFTSPPPRRPPINLHPLPLPPIPPHLKPSKSQAPPWPTPTVALTHHLWTSPVLLQPRSDQEVPQRGYM